MVLAFPRDRCRPSTGKIRGGHSCKVYILPAVRIERPPEPPQPKARKRKEKSP